MDCFGLVRHMTEIPDIGLVILEMALNQWAVLNQADMHFVALTVYRPFIDGTVASAYTHDDDTKSLVQFKDVNVQHDHTYYGMGCSNSWGEEGLGGSDVPCTTRIVPTVDDGNQKNGVYYTFQASISGSGASVTSSNKNSPDTFCPLGWQLPYSGTGGDYYDKSRSWDYLFTAYSISFNTGATADATKIKSYPFSYVYPGYYDWATGRLYSLGTSTGLWASTVNNSTGAYFMATWSTAVHSNLTTNRARGYTLRCIRFLASHHRRHGGRNISYPQR